VIPLSAGLGLILELTICLGAGLYHPSHEGAERSGFNITSRDAEYVSPMEARLSKGLQLP